jgi:hypothetical protein
VAVEAGLPRNRKRGEHRSLCPSHSVWRGSGWRRDPRYWLKPAVVWDPAVIGPEPLAGIRRGSRSSREGDRVFDRRRHAYVHERPAHRTALIDVTPDGLVKAISGI